MKKFSILMAIVSLFVAVGCCGGDKDYAGTRVEALDNAAWEASKWISVVDAPLLWVTIVTVPASLSKSLIVRGTRSPCSSALTMRNWPGCADAARRGASTFILQMVGVSMSLDTILYMLECLNKKPPLWGGFCSDFENLIFRTRPLHVRLQ